MDGKKVLIDTSIIIDHLQGSARATQLIKDLEYKYITSLSYAEIVAAVGVVKQEQILEFLTYFMVIDIDAKVAKQAAILIQSYSIQMLDALQLATAMIHRCELWTRNANYLRAVEDAPVRLVY